MAISPQKPADRMRAYAALLCAMMVLLQAGHHAKALQAQPTFAHPYGVFLSCDNTRMSAFTDYQTVVIDAAYFDQTDIATLKDAGHTVYSYLNVGSLEDFRPYYDRFVDLTLAPYEHWEGERWMDVSSAAWQNYLLDTLAAEYLSKGVDGFFIDNCDVYYLYPTQPIFTGLCTVLNSLTATGAAVIINGGDTFVTAYAECYGSVADILTGVNQETVFSRINFDSGMFGRAADEDHAYFMDYLERVAGWGGKVYLLEYTTDNALINEITAYCAKNGFDFYISDSIELD